MGKRFMSRWIRGVDFISFLPLTHYLDALFIKFVSSDDFGEFGIWFDSVGIRRRGIFVPKRHSARDEPEKLPIRALCQRKRFVRRSIRQLSENMMVKLIHIRSVRAPKALILF